MGIKKEKIKRILVITLSNIGDIVLTTPVVYALNKEYPQARLDVMVSPQGVEIFEDDKNVFKVIPYNKFSRLLDKFRLLKKMWQVKYDLVVDLRKTLFPILAGARYRTSIIKTKAKDKMHKKDEHLLSLKELGINTQGARLYLSIGAQDVKYIDRLIGGSGPAEKIVAVNPGAKSAIKRWGAEGFAEVCDRLIDECGAKILMVGDKSDKKIIEQIIMKMKNKPPSIAGLTSLKQLAEVLRRSKLLITNDSAPMHIACAVGTKVLAIFGPTEPAKYGPCGESDVVVRKAMECSPCEAADCRYDLECMHEITSEDVFNAAKKALQYNKIHDER